MRWHLKTKAEDLKHAAGQTAESLKSMAAEKTESLTGAAQIWALLCLVVRKSTAAGLAGNAKISGRLVRAVSVTDVGGCC